MFIHFCRDSYNYVDFVYLSLNESDHQIERIPIINVILEAIEWKHGVCHDSSGRDSVVETRSGVRLFCG